MRKLQVFDPPMCCSSGVCGTNVDTRLVTFASDLEWLKKQGVQVERYGLSFEPAEFVKNETVKRALEQEGNDCLPLVLADNKVVYKGGYPSREKLAEICEIKLKEDDSQEPVVAGISSSICGPECDCHKSGVNDNMKRIIFVIVLLVIAGIVAVKMYSKAIASQLNAVNNTVQSAISGNVQNVASQKIGKSINSLSQIKQNVAFVFIPSKNNAGISASTKNAALSAKKALQKNNIKAGLYTLNPSSPNYSSIASQTNPPAILVVCGQSKKFVTGDINQTKLLQAYVAATRDCGAGCPCHK